MRLRHVTVVGPELGTADALATALCAADTALPDWLDRFPGYAVMVIDRDAEGLG